MDLTDGWEVAGAPASALATPDDLPAAGLDWVPARVPGTVAAALTAANAEIDDLDGRDWWFRCRFERPETHPGEDLRLEFDGIATEAEAYLNGRPLLTSSSMWQAHASDVGDALVPHNELVIVCRALRPLLRRRRRPSARWRTRVVNDGNLRWHRTMVFGRSPGFAPAPAAVGPWRPVRLSPVPSLSDIAVRSRVHDGAGIVHVSARAGRNAAPAVVSAGSVSVPLTAAGDGTLVAELRIDNVRRWWPHTHGEPTLYDVIVHAAGEPVATRRVGFRSLRFPDDIPSAGLELSVNDVPVFLRGAVWTPADLISMAPSDAELRDLLRRVRDAGMNMLRIAGTGAYESTRFHDLCDELGILVWQDLMFANVDYPVADPDFRAVVEREAAEALASLAHRPSLAVVCGNNEVEQQPAMMGLDPGLGRDALWDEVLPEIVRQSGTDCAYVRSTPCGGVLPFHPDRGVTHYFGVSGYFMAATESRRAAVRFASECLAFANVPDEVEVPVHHPDWKRGVQRDAGTGWDIGAGWDFDDVRDHYLATLYRVDPVQLRRSDHARYLELSRAATGEVMADVMGEWRRRTSGCHGALVLWCKDMLPGAGLGVLDHRGRPKVAYHHLRRALAPIAVWTSDEGLTGVAIHVANDRGQALQGALRVALFRDHEIPVAERTVEISLAAHETRELSVEEILQQFVDAAWAYRFGPPSADVIAVTLQSPAAWSQAFRFPAGLPTYREPAERMGLEASAEPVDDRRVRLVIRTRRLAYGVRVHARGFAGDDDAFCVEPGHERTVVLSATGDDVPFSGATVTALNLSTELTVAPPA